MAHGRRRQSRQLAVDIAACVGASFSENRVEWDQFIETGELIIWDRHPLPMTPQIQAEIERLKRHEERLNAR